MRDATLSVTVPDVCKALVVTTDLAMMDAGTGMIADVGDGPTQSLPCTVLSIQYICDASAALRPDEPGSGAVIDTRERRSALTLAPDHAKARSSHCFPLGNALLE